MGSETAWLYDRDREKAVPMAVVPCTTESTEERFPTGVPGLIPECHIVKLKITWG